MIELKHVFVRESWKCSLPTESHIHMTTECMGNLELKPFCAIKIIDESAGKKRLFAYKH